jgi:aminotransferase
VALEFEEAYYESLVAEYAARRERLLAGLEEAGFRTFRPVGAYYVMTDISAFGFADDVSFARALVSEGKVAAVPGSSFYHDPARGKQRLRFHFARRLETIDEAVERLRKFGARGAGERT